jgi:hypothetical protein
MRRFLLLSLLLLPACVPGGARAPSPAELPPTTYPTNVPDMTGEWVVKPNSGAYPEIWTIQQSGNTLVGTITFDPSAIPAGFANPPHDLFGSLQENGFGWIAQMQTPDGNLTLSDPYQFTFCPKPTGAQPCRIGLKRLRPPSPSPGR